MEHPVLFSCPRERYTRQGPWAVPGGCSGQTGTAESVLGHSCPSVKCLKGHCSLVTERIQKERWEITGKRSAVDIGFFVVELVCASLVLFCFICLINCLFLLLNM